MTEELVMKSIKIITFDGKKASYNKWKTRFLAKAGKAQRDVLTGAVVPPVHDVDLDPESENDKPLIQARKANEEAYAALLMAIEDDVNFQAVSNSKTED